MYVINHCVKSLKTSLPNKIKYWLLAVSTFQRIECTQCNLSSYAGHHKCLAENHLVVANAALKYCACMQAYMQSILQQTAFFLL